MPKRPRHYWLMKSEPEAFSIDDLEHQGHSPWDGVRNYRARNLMRDEMAVGDLVLFYHSNATVPGVVGIARVASQSYPDPTQFDPTSPYFDAKASQEQPRWWLVDVAFVERLPEVVSLAELKDDVALQGMWVTRRGMRLSVQPVEKHHFKHVLRRARARTVVR
jgi:predicted RNA-binding protein with PUA-like domain